MKAIFLILTVIIALSAYSMEQDKAKLDSIVDTAMQVADTIGRHYWHT